MKRAMRRGLVMAMVAGAAALVQAQAAQTPAPAAKAQGAPTQAQTQAALPTVDQVLAKYVTALGGRAAIQKLTSRVAKGTLEVPEQGISGTVTLQSKAPNKRRYTIDIVGYGLVEQSFNGSAGWANSPDTGLRDLGEEELGYERLATDFYAALNIAKSYSSLMVKGKEKAGEQDVFVVEGKQPDGFTRVMFFDAATGLLVRFTAERGGPGGSVKVDSYLEDYREVDGVKLPHTLRQVNPQATLITHLTEIQHNVPIEDSVFEKPAKP